MSRLDALLDESKYLIKYYALQRKKAYLRRKQVKPYGFIYTLEYASYRYWDGHLQATKDTINFLLKWA